MSQVLMTYCDGEHAERVEGRSHTVVINGEAFTADLCADHATPITDLADTLRAIAKVEQRTLEGSLLCDLCDETFTGKAQLTRHKVDSHGVNTSAYSCRRCERGYARSESLTRHLVRDHQVEREQAVAESKISVA